jgi:hypothetical protein
MAKNFDPEIGKNTRWRKGQRSPNPGGRPRYGIVSAYPRQALQGGDADKIARSLLNQAKRGNLRAISEVIDRTEGKATQTMEGRRKERAEFTRLAEYVERRTRRTPHR